MKSMNTDRIKQCLECKLLHTIYNKIYVVDLATHSCGEWAAEQCTILNLQSYDNWLISLAKKMYKPDAAAFFTEMNFDYIYASLTQPTSHHVVYYRWEENGRVQELRLSICYMDELCTHFVFLQEELSSDYPRPLETMNEISHCNARFQFLVNHLVVDFIEINIDTGVCYVVSEDSSMRMHNNYKDQITWWAEHIIVPEEQEAYVKEYELTHLTRSLRANNGHHHATYTTCSGAARNSIHIISTLIKENYGKSQEYIFAYAQDITQIKAQETRNKQLVDISQQLLTLSQTEPVTGLYNRAAFEKLVEEHFAATAKGVPGAMLLIDIDRFKEFNDQYGHPTGDFVLKFLGKTMQDVFRSDDILSRWGGDEFVVFMKNVCEQKIIIGRVERLRAKLRQCKMNAVSLPITISIGGKIAASGMTIDVVFGHCDRALYQVKSQGRNGFLIDSE